MELIISANLRKAIKSMKKINEEEGNLKLNDKIEFKNIKKVTYVSV